LVGLCKLQLRLLGAQISVYYIDGGCKMRPAGPVAYGSILKEWLDTAHNEAITDVVLTNLETFNLPQAHTNNEAEYGALLRLLRRGNLTAEDWIFTDSQLLIGHLTKGWNVRAENLRPLFQEALTLLAQQGSPKLRRVPRAEIFRKVGH
jgi:ribonuclease HI